MNERNEKKKAFALYLSSHCSLEMLIVISIVSVVVFVMAAFFHAIFFYTQRTQNKVSAIFVFIDNPSTIHNALWFH